MATIEQYGGRQFPYVLMGTYGTSGDLVYHSTGSGMTYKSASTGTGVSDQFLGILADSCATGDYSAVICDAVVQLEKHAAANKIEVGNVIYGTKSSNKVGTVAGGTAIGVCFKQSATTDTYVSVKLLPYFVSAATGFHA